MKNGLSRNWLMAEKFAAPNFSVPIPDTRHFLGAEEKTMATKKKAKKKSTKKKTVKKKAKKK